MPSSESKPVGGLRRSQICNHQVILIVTHNSNILLANLIPPKKKKEGENPIHKLEKGKTKNINEVSLSKVHLIADTKLIGFHADAPLPS